MNRPTREDCWSDGATETLIEAWGDRYVQLNRGNLRQTDWKEIATAVKGRHNGVKPPKTDVQCKNRVDTLKKKYKVEKSKPTPSTWLFYHRLHSLIASNDVVHNNIVTLTFNTKKPIPIDSDGSMESSHEAVKKKKKKKKQRFLSVELSEGAATRELAWAIVKFGEIYERIERSKQEQMIEMEKERMELTKELEFQRMNMFMDTQLKLQKRLKKLPKFIGTSSGKM